MSDPAPTGRSRREITEALAARILAHLAAERPAAGTHLPAQDFADRFGVSRSPVNQALRLLADKGVLDHAANRGFFLKAGETVSAAALGLADDDLSATYLRLAEDRLAGRIPEQVSESFLRQRYALTRGQLSALLGRVAQEGWAERRAGYGWAFSPMLTTPEALEQTYRVRVALEPAALLEPGYRLDPAVAARCRAAERRLLDGAIATESAEALYERGVRFHEAIVGASGNPFFLETIRRINRVRRLLSYRSMLDRRRYDRQCREHLAILDLLEAEKNDEAAVLLRAHLEGTIQSFSRIRDLLET